MIKECEFLKLVMDSLSDRMVVIDDKANIIWVNKAWVQFGRNNNCPIDEKWEQINYLEECYKSAVMGDKDGSIAASGIQDVIASRKNFFYYEYPCHSPNNKRWFMMRITPLDIKTLKYFLITHQDITERKIAEEKVLALSRLDGLTNISNRKTFDQFLHNEWARCSRLKMPVSLAFIDIDHFKLLNDTYGHQKGDECLKKFSKMLKSFAKRPGDICARYGGEEFVLLLGNTENEAAISIIYKLLDKTRKLNIPNKKSPTSSILTASIGLATICPKKNSSHTDLVKEADKLLYKAKENGRNRVEFST